MPSFNTTIIRCNDNDEEIEYNLEVEFSYYKPQKGLKDSFGRPIEPDFPGDVEIERVMDIETGKNFELTSDEENDIYEELYDFVMNDT